MTEDKVKAPTNALSPLPPLLKKQPQLWVYNFLTREESNILTEAMASEIST